MNRLELQIAKEVSEELGVSEQDVIDSITAVKEFLVKVISKGEFDSFRIPYFGIFKAKKFRVYAVNNPEEVQLLKKNKKYEKTI